MNSKWNRQYTRLGKLLLAPAALSAFLLLVGLPAAVADEGHECRERIEKAEAKLEKEVRKHGWRSRQAEKRRADLNAARERCWNQHHRWYSGRDHNWHNDRDWDRDDNRDHDHDQDRDDHH